MFDPQDRSWTTKSIVLTNTNAEIRFSLADEFYKDPNILDETSRVAIPAPALESEDPYYPSSIEVLSHVGALAEHYRAVLKLARLYGHSYNEYCQHFWLRLQFEGAEGGIPFPWYDTLESMERLFDWLHSAADGDEWHDVEQGWEVIAIRIGQHFHLRLGGFDQGGEFANFALPRDPLLASVASLRERMGALVTRLTAELGEDYWTRHRYDLRTDLDR